MADGRRWRPTPFLVASAGANALAAASLLVVPPPQWHWLLAGFLWNQIVLTLAGMLPRAALLGPNQRSLPAPCDGRVALTFDDGPDPAVTPLVLDLLDRHHARASFFCIGREVERHPELTREIAARGHRIENHSYQHSKRFALFGPATLRAEIDRAQQAIAEASGRAPTLFRAPAGLRNPLLEPTLVRSGLRLVSWTRRGFDTLSRDPQRVASRLSRGLAAGDILLLHDGSPARDGASTPVSLSALALVLERMDALGLRSFPVDD